MYTIEHLYYRHYSLEYMFIFLTIETIEESSRGFPDHTPTGQPLDQMHGCIGVHVTF